MYQHIVSYPQAVQDQKERIYNCVCNIIKNCDVSLDLSFVMIIIFVSYEYHKVFSRNVNQFWWLMFILVLVAVISHHN